MRRTHASTESRSDPVAERFTYSSAPARREKIVEFVQYQGYCAISELSDAFSVSEMTIRRDVARLVEQGRLRGFHGGVGSLAPQEMTGSAYSDRDITMADAKRAIAARAREFVTRDSVIAIDAGTTATRLASLLPADEPFQVVTNSFSALSEIIGNPAADVTCLGGQLHAESLSFAGPATLATITNLQVDTLFLAASGLNERGAFCGTGFDAITKRALIDVAEHVILIADSSKFSTNAMVRICGWDAIDMIIVDEGLSADARSILEKNNVTITLAGSESS